MLTARRPVLLLLAALGAASLAHAQDRPRFPNPSAAGAQSARVATAGYTLIEFETLVRAAAASPGPVSVQPMAGFGPNWSGNSQLFWAPPSSNPRDPATLTVTFNAPSPGDYSIRLGYTQAPDYGDVQLYIAGELERELNGYAPNVRLSRTTLADRHLNSGPNELTLKVFRKNAQSRGYFAGLDSIELLLIKAGANRDLQTRAGQTPASPAQSTAQQTPQGPILPNSAKLAYSDVDAKLNQGALGGIEGEFYESNPSILLAWETTAKNFQWRWQVATQPFPAESALTAPGLIAQRDVDESPFTIDFSHVPPFGTPLPGLQSGQGGAVTQLPQGAASAQPAQRGGVSQPAAATKTKPGPMTLYVRLVPIVNGAVAGPPSNSVIAHYKTGVNPLEQVSAAAANTEEYKKKMVGYSISVVSYQPAKWPDRIGCVVVVANPFYQALANPVATHPLAKYKVGDEYCPQKKDDDKDALYWVGQAFKGWFLAAELGADYYNNAKDWIVDQIVGPIPCEWLGDDLEETCDGALHVIVDGAITAAMASAGVPPTMPSLSQLAAAAKGDLLDAAVDFTCDQVKELGDEECSELAKEQIRKLYEQGLEQMIKEAKRGAQEPDCDNADLAVSHYPLPCFTNYPGTEVKPAAGAVYVPPMVTINVTRTAPHPSPYLWCTAHLSLWSENQFTGNSYVQGQKLDAKAIKGELYEPARVAIPILPQGQSATLKVALQQMKLFSIASNASLPSGSLGEWGELYWGGKGTLTVTSDGPLPKTMSSGRSPCSQPATLALALPSKP